MPLLLKHVLQSTPVFLVCHAPQHGGPLPFPGQLCRKDLLQLLPGQACRRRCLPLGLRQQPKVAGVAEMGELEKCLQ